MTDRDDRLRRLDPAEIERILQEKYSDPAFRADAIGALEAAKARLQQLPPPQAPEARPAPPEAPETPADDPERLLTAKEVGEVLGIPTKSVYELGGLERVQLGERRVRWRLPDVRAFIQRRRETF